MYFGSFFRTLAVNSVSDFFLCKWLPVPFTLLYIQTHVNISLNTTRPSVAYWPTAVHFYCWFCSPTSNHSAKLSFRGLNKINHLWYSDNRTQLPLLVTSLHLHLFTYISSPPPSSPLSFRHQNLPNWRVSKHIWCWCVMSLKQCQQILMPFQRIKNFCSLNSRIAVTTDLLPRQYNSAPN